MEEQQDLLHIGEYVKQRWKVVCVNFYNSDTSMECDREGTSAGFHKQTTWCIKSEYL